MYIPNKDVLHLIRLYFIAVGPLQILILIQLPLISHNALVLKINCRNVCGLRRTSALPVLQALLPYNAVRIINYYI